MERSAERRPVLRLLRQAGALAQLSAELGVVPSQVHASLARLECAGLVRPGTRAANRHALAEFVEDGVRYAFPARVGERAIGVPTGIPRIDWQSTSPRTTPSYGPHPRPTVPFVDCLLHRSTPVPSIFASNRRRPIKLVALVDALRVGSARERALAKQHLHNAFETSRSAA